MTDKFYALDGIEDKMKFNSFKEAVIYALTTGEKIRNVDWPPREYIWFASTDDATQAFIDENNMKYTATSCVHCEKNWETYSKQLKEEV